MRDAGESMIPKSGTRFSEKIMRNEWPEWDDDSKNRHPTLVAAP
jgi:hypothetical protein